MKVRCKKCGEETELKFLGNGWNSCSWKCKHCGYENYSTLLNEKEKGD